MIVAFARLFAVRSVAGPEHAKAAEIEAFARSEAVMKFLELRYFTDSHLDGRM